MPYDNAEFLTADDLVKRYGKTVTRKTLANWRSQRIGPPYVRVGRAILYPKKCLIMWEQSRVTITMPVAEEERSERVAGEA